MFNRLSNNSNNELNVAPSESCHLPGAGATRVTLNLPAAAVDKLSRLAEAGGGEAELLRDLGILSLKVEGGQIISMTMVGDSESEDVRQSPAKTGQIKSSPRDAEKCGPGPATHIKQEPVTEPGHRATAANSSFGLGSGLGSLIAGASSRDLAALFNKNHSSLSYLSPAEQQSVLQSYMSTMSAGGAVSGATEALMSSLMSSKSGSSSLHLSKDNGEPVNKKPRKHDSESGVISPAKHSPKSKMDHNSSVSGASSSTFPYSKSGQVSLLPVNNCTTGSSSLKLGSGLGSHQSADSIKSAPPSALRIASLPGVSLTAVSSRSNTQSSGGSGSGSGSGLMPPPPPTSAVTLSPVPRSSSSSSSVSSVSSSSSSSSCAGIEPGDKSVSSASVSKVQSDNNISLSQSLDKRPLLINPVTGQFEAGLSESGGNDKRKNDQSSDSDIIEEDMDENVLRHQRTKSGSQSPANSTSEHPLKFKLKVSSTPVNNSSKNLLAPKNDVMLKSGSCSSKSSLEPTEPKVPKLKIRLGKDKNAVKLKNNDVENHENSNDLDDNFSMLDKSHSSNNSPQSNDLKTKIKIKPLTGSPGSTSDPDTAHNSITGPYFPNLANNIVNHASIEDKRVKKKEGKNKDRQAVWMESLAKHGQRAEDGDAKDKAKETKSWPEVLEARLYGSGGSGGSHNSNSSSPTGSDHGGAGSLSFSKYDSVLENQTEKGEDQRSIKSEDNNGGESSSSPSSSRTEEAGDEKEKRETEGEGGQAVAQGPGITAEAHLNGLGPGGRDLPGPGHTHSPPHHPPPVAQPASQTETGPGSSLNTVLDILEGRPALSDPMSPDCPVPRAREQQGEDSGIESMDSRSEKSPNQGESPFHGSTESDMGRTPTYSSSYSGSSGKMSPPVSEISSCDPGPGSGSVSPHSSTFTQPVQSAVGSAAAGPDTDPSKNSFLEESHKKQVTITTEKEAGPILNEVVNTGNDLNEAQSNGEATTSKTENGESFENHKNEVETKSEEVLLRSCDGADDPKLPVAAESEKAEITDCMHDYASNNQSAVQEAQEQPSAPTAGLKAVTGLSSVKMSSAPVVTTVNIGGSAVAVRPGLQVPPGARMVPVKLVTVPGATGNVRMLRVSPVKTCVTPGALPPRTVVIKSSVLKAVSSHDQVTDGLGSGQASLVRFPGSGHQAPASGPASTDNCDNTAVISAASSQTSQSLSSIVTSASSSSSTLLKKSHQVSLTPVETNSCSLDTNTKAAPVTFQKRASVEDAILGKDAPLSVDVTASNSRLKDLEQMPSPAQKAAQSVKNGSSSSSSKCNGESDPSPSSSDNTTPSSPPKITKGKKSSGDSALKNDMFDASESLLRPLLAKEDPAVSAELSPAASPLSSLDSPSVLSLPLINPRKRTRRDTGSSVNSVGSDMSSKSGELPASKRNRATSPATRRKSQSVERSIGNKSDENQSNNADKNSNGENKNNTSSNKTKSEIGNGLPEAESATKKSKTLERSKGRTSVKNSNNTNIKTESKKPSPKKTDTLVKKMGRPPKLEAAAENSATGTTFDKTGPTKVEAQGRRVSARSKKPAKLVLQKEFMFYTKKNDLDSLEDETNAVVTKRR